FGAIRDGSGFFQHGHTYMGHATACAGALEVQRVIAEEGLLENVRAMGALLERQLTERLGNHRHVGDIRGRGLFRGIELVADRATREPFDPESKLAARIKEEAMRRGLMCYPMGGTIDGVRGDHVLLAPPFIVEPDHVDMITERLADAIDAAIARAAA
ncbi:MAG TPA: aminotransferase class III-fold pyridoxal phosphate-dependent enzyme, partial [Alphaproteobacteria bacterium]|nr:aminotransferase class III-fold pyridoxal phosphate-dependent enzyme [Alphaproteobacteria bacterium]